MLPRSARFRWRTKADEQRKYAILFAATILAARKLNDPDMRCSDCGKEYSVDYNRSDELRIANFKERMLAAAKQAVDESHPLHPIYVDVHEV